MSNWICRMEKCVIIDNLKLAMFGIFTWSNGLTGVISDCARSSWWYICWCIPGTSSANDWSICDGYPELHDLCFRLRITGWDYNVWGKLIFCHLLSSVSASDEDENFVSTAIMLSCWCYRNKIWTRNLSLKNWVSIFWI